MATLSLDRLELRLRELVEPWTTYRTGQAMAYALLGGGKRLRPRLVLAQVSEITQDALDVACALEMIHTYSLIHDDLPALDNDELRRGRPTVHIAFDEATAILAGDGLLNAAFETVLSLKMDSDRQIMVLRLLARASGIHGMIGGQDHDLFSVLNTSDAIVSMYRGKTGKLLGASLALGAVLDGRPQDAEALMDLGIDLGVLFQIQDDVLELTQSTETLGKSNQSDVANQKSTYVSLNGLEGSNREIERLSQHIQSRLFEILRQPQETMKLIEAILVRNH